VPHERLGEPRQGGGARPKSGPVRQYMTWPAAYRIADAQVAYWQRTGITADEAQRALQCDFPAAWDDVRRRLAAWAMAHKDRWEE